MNTLETVNAAVSMICMIITAIMAWVALYRRNQVDVSFAGTPVDKKEFDKALAENKGEHEKIFAKFEAMHFRINPIEGELRALREAGETNTTRLVQMDGKIDRLIERMK